MLLFMLSRMTLTKTEYLMTCKMQFHSKHPCINDLVYSYIPHMTILIQLTVIIISEVTLEGGGETVFGKIFNIISNVKMFKSFMITVLLDTRLAINNKL